jgi:uncharacterized protein YprB with RNaseH-like and TPR domain
MSTLNKFSRLAALKPARPAPARPMALRAADEEDALARLLGAGVAKNHYGEHLAVRNWFSTPEFAEASPVALELLARGKDESISRRTLAALADPAKWLFLDTETTGLAGGTGTYAFLIGLAWWDAGGLQVEQLFMRDFAEEHSLLHELAARIAERPVLVTFNGKSFDWPLLESRFTMTRAIVAPRLSAHLDLLHPARALWKLRLGSVRLIELERHVLDAPRLGWRRDDDISSALIPQFYFDYLRGGPAEPLAGVARHNQMDLRGLAALFGKINFLLASQESAPAEMDSLDLFGLSRFLQRRGKASRAEETCAQAIDLGLPSEIRPQACRQLALLAKRRGDHEQAATLWLELAAGTHDAIQACEQLAIHYERRAKDILRAAEFATLAMAKLKQARSRSRDPYAVASTQRLEDRILRRIARLEERLRPSREAKNAPLLARLEHAPATVAKRRAAHNS